MGSKAVGMKLDEDRSPALTRFIERERRPMMNGEEIVAVHLIGGDPISRGLFSERARAALLMHWEADRVAIITAKKDHGRIERGGHREPFVKALRARRSISEEDSDSDALTAELCRISETCRVRNLRTD